MRRLFLVLALVTVPACAGSPTGPSSANTLVNIVGAWTGTLASSNNPTVDIAVDLTQNGSDVRGSWHGTDISWSGNVTATINGSALSGQLTFTGITANQVTCTGMATISGSVNGTSMTLDSSNGVLGGTCPAPLPASIRIELRRNSGGAGA